MRQVDWHSLACLLGERQANPVVVLDRSGVIQLFNRAAEELFGFSRFEAIGQQWSAVTRRTDAHDWIAEALRGVLRTYRTAVITRGALSLELTLELSLVGTGTDQCVLATVVESRVGSSFSAVMSGHDVDYEVSTEPRTFGILSRLCLDGEIVRELPAGCCYKALFGLDAPCEDCPAMPEDGRWPRTRVRVKNEGPEAQYQLLTSERAGASQVRMRLRTVTAGALHDLQAARIDDTARRAGLSPRERDVLRLLILGRAMREIADALGITVRTVKHHQASLLAKLGAESRADLLRILT
jgi:DNA-binding CsgD family transcriptional regulator